MKKFILLSFILLISAIIGYSSVKYAAGYFELAGIFLSGVVFGVFIMMFSINSKNDMMTVYKRELEKKSVSTLESDDRVKVLESKIEVLEKALEKALNK